MQHHHAQLAVVAIFDEGWLGPDSTVWGGELMVGSAGDYERAGLLFPVRLPGGDAALRDPWRMACSWVMASLGQETPAIPRTLAGEVDTEHWEAVCDQIRGGVASPLTTSAGRLLDAVSVLCGTQEVPQPGRGYPMPLVADGDAPILIDARETIRALLADLEGGEDEGIVAGRFHEALAAATAEACGRIASDRDIDTVVLAGSVFESGPLADRTAELLTESGRRVLRS